MAVAPAIGLHGNGQQLRLVCDRPPQGEAVVPPVDLREGGRRRRARPAVRPCPDASRDARQEARRPADAARQRDRDRALRSAGRTRAFISFDGATRAIGRGDVDAAQIERTWQALRSGCDCASLRRRRSMPTGRAAGDRAGTAAQPHWAISEASAVGLRAQDPARLSRQPIRQRFGRREEWRAVTCRKCAKPVTEMGIDGGDRETVIGLGGRQQDGRRGEAGQWHVQSQGEPARGSEADAHAREAARSDGDGDHRQRAAIDRRPAAARRRSPASRSPPVRVPLPDVRKTDIVPHDRDAEAAHGAVEGQDRHRLALPGAAGHCIGHEIRTWLRSLRPTSTST